MATFNVTVANALSLFASPSDQWGAWNWNAFLWGVGTADFQTTAHKYLTGNEITAASVMDPIGVEAGVTCANTLTLTADMSSESLQDGSGYSYVFPDRTTEAEGRDIPSWSSGAAGSGSWTSATAASTTWSDA